MEPPERPTRRLVLSTVPVWTHFSLTKNSNVSALSSFIIKLSVNVPFLALTLLKDAVGKRGYSLFYTSFPGQP
jgi:hypothetical protein